MKAYSVALLAAIVLFASCKKEDATPPPTVASTEKSITSFKFLKKDNASLESDVTATLAGQKFTAEIPANVTERNLVATFAASSKAKVRANSVDQVSGQTPNSFSNAVTYEVEAGDKSKATYTVEIKPVGHAPLQNANATTSYEYRTSSTTWINYNSAMPSSIQFYAGGYLGRAVYDFDKDGDEDIVAGNLNYDANGLVNAPRPFVYLDNQGGVYTDATGSKLPGSPGLVHPRKAIVGDFDNNGWMDVVVAGHGFDSPPFPGEKAILLKNQNGVFTAVDLMPIGFYHSVSSGDIDNDGDIDLFFTDTKNCKFFINNGSGTFTYDNTIFPSDIANTNYFTSEIYDLNADGYLDVIISGHEYENAATTVLWGNYTGKFSKNRSTVLPGIQGWGIAIDLNILDINKDGKQDIIVNRQADGTGSLEMFHGLNIQVLTQQSNGTFSDQTNTIISNNLVSTHPQLEWFWVDWLRVYDMDNDGDKDLITDNKYYNLQWSNTNGVFTKLQ
jgi:hypothetical protein